MNSIQDMLLQEFEVSINMIRLAISNMDDQKWGVIHNHWSYAQTLYHTIDTLDFYIHDGPEDMKKGGELGIETRGMEETKIHELTAKKDKNYFFKNIDRVENLVKTRLELFDDVALLKKDKFSEWGFQHRFHKFSYTLRHTMIHLGELSKTLRDQGKETVKWL